MIIVIVLFYRNSAFQFSQHQVSRLTRIGHSDSKIHQLLEEGGLPRSGLCVCGVKPSTGDKMESL